MHLNVVTYANIDIDNAMSPVWHQAIIWTNADLSSIWILGMIVNEIFIKIPEFSLRKYIWKCHLQNGGHFIWASIWKSLLTNMNFNLDFS